MNRKIVKLYNQRLKATKQEVDDTWEEFVNIVNINKQKKNNYEDRRVENK